MTARYECRAELVDLIRGLEERAIERAERGYDIACAHTTHVAEGEITETVTVRWSARAAATMKRDRTVAHQIERP